MANKEQIYDEQIAPAMAKIADICKANEIDFFATFHIPNGNPEDDDLMVSSMGRFGNSEHTRCFKGFAMKVGAYL